MPQQKRDKKADTHFFAIYEVSLSEAVNRNLFLKETDGTKPIDHAQEHFENTLQGNALPLVKVKQLPKRKGETVAQEDSTALHNDILAAREHVFLLRINNEKHKTVIQEDGLEADGKVHYGEKKVGSYPYCYVVIDNRPAQKAGDAIILAIQKNSAFGDPKNVRKVLERYFNNRLNEYGLQAELSLRTRPSKIWEFCRTMHDHGDTITRISFNIPNQKKVALNNRIPKEDKKGIVGQMAKVAEQTEALKTLVQCDYDSADPNLLEKHANDFVNIFHVCKSKEYRLEIKFKNYGNYSCDDRVTAILPMPEQLLNAFRNGEQELKLNNEQKGEIYGWCDWVREQCKIYDTIPQIPAKRHR